MTDHEQRKFEDQLRQLKPGKLPEELVRQIQATVLSGPVPSPKAVAHSPGFLQILRWLIPAAAVLLVTAVVWRYRDNSGEQRMSVITSQENRGNAALKPSCIATATNNAAVRSSTAG